MDGRATLDAGLAKTINHQISAVRRLFEEEGFVEIFVPHLTRNYATPFRSSFQVTSAESNFIGALRVSSGWPLANASTVLERVYTVHTSFRAAPIPGSQLAEFQLIEAWGTGTFDDVHDLAERLLRTQVRASLEGSEFVSKERRAQLDALKFPLPSVTYAEAVERAGLQFGRRPSSDIAPRIVEAFRSTPVFITNIPGTADPSFVDIRQDGDGTHMAFLLMAPMAGNVMAGGEVETDYDALSSQIDGSAYLQELVRLGGDREQFEPYLRTVASLSAPRFLLVVGFERMTQFLLGAEQIEDAAFMPVSGKRQEVTA
jgi:aspartyl/asparaginyl-tRNA synthetase